MSQSELVASVWQASATLPAAFLATWIAAGPRIDLPPARGWRPAKARDYQCGTLTYDGHNGTDFRVPTLAAQRAGVRVLAAATGRVLRVRDGVADVLQPSNALSSDDRACGNGIVIAHAGNWETQYSHLAKGSVSVKPGDLVPNPRSSAALSRGSREVPDARAFPDRAGLIDVGGFVDLDARKTHWRRCLRAQWRAFTTMEQE